MDILSDSHIYTYDIILMYIHILTYIYSCV